VCPSFPSLENPFDAAVTLPYYPPVFLGLHVFARTLTSTICVLGLAIFSSALPPQRRFHSQHLRFVMCQHSSFPLSTVPLHWPHPFPFLRNLLATRPVFSPPFESSDLPVCCLSQLRPLPFILPPARQIGCAMIPV